MPKETTPSVAEQADERAAFEVWFSEDGNYEPEWLDWHPSGMYSNADTQNMFDAWQARAALQSKACASVGVEPAAFIEHTDSPEDGAHQELVWEKDRNEELEGPMYGYTPLYKIESLGLPDHDTDAIAKALQGKDVTIGRTPYEDIDKAIAWVMGVGVGKAIAALASPAPSVGEPTAFHDFLERWAHIGRLQTFADRERFREEANKLLATQPAAPAVAEGASIDKVRAIIERVNRKGGLGYDVHAWLADALALIAAPAAAVPESPAWIDVKDRVPTHLYSVLGVVTDGPFVVQGDPEDRMRDVVSYSPERGWLQHDGNDSVVVTVSHWQEMADLP